MGRGENGSFWHGSAIIPQGKGREKQPWAESKEGRGGTSQTYGGRAPRVYRSRVN